VKIENLPLPSQLKKVYIEEGIQQLYPPQEEAVKAGLLDSRKNLVVATPTASGKTLIAEMAVVKSIIENGGKAAYLVPLRAIATEKYDEVKKKYSKQGLKVAVSIGDYDSSEAQLGEHDIIVMTYEKFDSIIRHKADWINDLTDIVLDEVHLVTEPDRGPTLEMTVAKLLHVNPRVRLIALSATISNTSEITSWLSSMLVQAIGDL